MLSWTSAGMIFWWLHTHTHLEIFLHQAISIAPLVHAVIHSVAIQGYSDSSEQHHWSQPSCPHWDWQHCSPLSLPSALGTTLEPRHWAWWYHWHHSPWGKLPPSQASLTSDGKAAFPNCFGLTGLYCHQTVYGKSTKPPSTLWQWRQKTTFLSTPDHRT